MRRFANGFTLVRSESCARPSMNLECEGSVLRLFVGDAAKAPAEASVACVVGEPANDERAIELA